VELNAHVASILVGPGAARLRAIEERTRRRFFVVGKEGVPAEHFKELERGPVSKLQPEGPVEEGQERQLKLVEVGLHDRSAGVGKEGELAVCVAGAAAMVGKRVKARITRVLEGIAYAELVTAPGEAPREPITAEVLAEKPTRARRSRAAKPTAEAEAEPEVVDAEAPEEAEEVEEAAEEVDEAAEEQPKKKRTRRGSRGGRRRKKKPAEAVAAETGENGEPSDMPVLIHVPDPELGVAGAEGETTTDGAQPKKKRSRRGSRGGRRRKKPAAAKTDTAES
jgi:predicted RNA-binding protein with TRAM domain